MELRDYARVIWRWLWLILLGVAVAVGATMVAMRGEPSEYEARAALMVGQVLQEQQPSAAEMSLARELARTYSDLASRRTVREPTMDALGLDWLPEYHVSPVPNTQLLEIRVIDTDPGRAAAVANELAQQLILQAPTSTGPEEAQDQEFVQEQLDDLEATISATKAEIARQQEALAGMFSAREIANTQAEIAALEQKLRSDQANYNELLILLGQGAVNTLSLIESATPPTQPTGSGRMMTLAMAGAVGLVLGLATAFLLDYLDDTIRTPEDVDRTMGLTTLAGISLIPGKEPAEKLVTARQPKWPISEAFRALRTSLQLGNPERPLRTLVITSPSPTEGKSTIAANLAVVMAQAGKRVVLLDTDLRRPSLHHIFEVSNRQGGLTEALLSDNPTLDWYLKPTAVENLRLFTSGPLPPYPAELLGSPRMAALIDRLKEESDVLLFDSAPVLALTDASVLATQADGTLLVIEAGKTRPSLAKEAAERLRRLGVHIVGVTINRLQPGHRSYDYYYTSYEAYHVRDGKWKRAWAAIRRRWAGLLGRGKRERDREDAREEKPIS
jgi:succinoglycan biosynthesis transport protein ExoP